MENKLSLKNEKQKRKFTTEFENKKTKLTKKISCKTNEKKVEKKKVKIFFKSGKKVGEKNKGKTRVGRKRKRIWKKN